MRGVHYEVDSRAPGTRSDADGLKERDFGARFRGYQLGISLALSARCWPRPLRRLPAFPLKNLQSDPRQPPLMALSNKFGLPCADNQQQKSRNGRGVRDDLRDMATVGFASAKTCKSCLCGSLPSIVIQGRRDHSEVDIVNLSEGYGRPATLQYSGTEILQRYVEEGQNLDDIVAAGFDSEGCHCAESWAFIGYPTNTSAAEYAGVKITPKPLAKRDRLPIAIHGNVAIGG